MDELLLLEAGPEAEYLLARPALKSIRAPDFTGSLDYIDSLASRRSLTVSWRDVGGITAAVLNRPSLTLAVPQAAPGPTDVGFEVSSTDFRPLGDSRTFHPEGVYRRPAALRRSSSDVIASRPRLEFPPGWRNPLDPTRETDELNRVMRDMERRIRRHPFSFRRPSDVVICLKRKIRRRVMHALGFAGQSGFNPPTRTYYSRVIC